MIKENKTKNIDSLISNRAIFLADNLDILKNIKNNFVDLIYLDPPFNKKRSFNGSKNKMLEGASFKDIWSEDDTTESDIKKIKKHYINTYKYINSLNYIGDKSNKYYISYMAIRLIEMKRILKNTGNIFIHIDPTISHYIKLLMDTIFDEKNFINEIVWSYKTGGCGKKTFSKKHDIILWYSKSSNYIFNPQKEKSYTKSKSRKSGITNYGKAMSEFFQDENGIYNITNMRDVWEIAYINSQAKERTGYPTQKPRQLLEIIIKSASNENSLVLDPFAGSGVTAVVAEKLKRKWIVIDKSKKSINLIRNVIKKYFDKNVYENTIYENRLK